MRRVTRRRFLANSGLGLVGFSVGFSCHGKNRPKASERLMKTVELPPYYLDDAILRKDWASYLASWEVTDREVGRIIADLKREDIYEKTSIFFFTDHGVKSPQRKTVPV
jgi:arylsulfatase A-like enzyme